MVVGGFTSHDQRYLAAQKKGTATGQGILTNDVELVTNDKVGKSCSKAAIPIFLGAFINEQEILEDVGDALGMTGRFTRESPIGKLNF